MSAIEIALHKTVRPDGAIVASSMSLRFRAWVAAHAIELADMIAGKDQDASPLVKGHADNDLNPWARPVGLARSR